MEALDSQPAQHTVFPEHATRKKNSGPESPDPKHSPSRRLIDVGLQVDIKPAVVRPPEEVPGPGSYEPHLSEQLLTLEKLRHSSMFSRLVPPITYQSWYQIMAFTQAFPGFCACGRGWSSSRVCGRTRPASCESIRSKPLLFCLFAEFPRSLSSRPFLQQLYRSTGF